MNTQSIREAQALLAAHKYCLQRAAKAHTYRDEDCFKYNKQDWLDEARKNLDDAAWALGYRFMLPF